MYGVKKIVSLTLLIVAITCIGFSQEGNKTDVLLQQLEKAKSDTARVNILNDLSREYAYSEPEIAVKHLKEAIQLSKKNNYTYGLSRAYLIYGIVFYFQYEFDSTLSYYNQSLLLNIQLNNQKEIANLYNNIGLIHHIKADYSQAIDFYSKGLKIRTQINDLKGGSESYNNIGAIYYEQGNYEKALENYFKSLAISEDLQDMTMSASTLANIGGIYEEQDKTDKALEYFLRANNMATKAMDRRRMADTYRNIGGVYDTKEKFDSAIIQYQNALTIYEEIEDYRGLIVIYNLFGQSYRNKYEIDSIKDPKLLDKAKKYYEQSQQLNQKEVDDAAELIYTYQGFGDLFSATNQYKKAIPYYLEAKQMAEEIESIESIKLAHEGLSKAYAALRKYKKAYQNHVQFKNWHDTLRSSENVEVLTQMSMQHEFDKQQKIQELEYQQKLKRQRLIRSFILTGFIIVLLFSIQVFRSYQRKKRDNKLLAEQNEKIEKQKEEITDSIKYAKRIQSAILPSAELAEEILPEHFILFRPRDIVSGDYYWMNKVGNKVIIVAADCTGHGVPGAFMSMLGVSFLNEIVNKNNIEQPNLILNHLRKSVKNTLGQTGKEGEAKDGMDIALCLLDYDNMTLQYAGAYNPLWLYRNGELIEQKADKMPIGIYIREKDSFTNHEIKLQKGDTFYIFSDGYADQFGGENGSKFKSKPFKRLLANIQSKSMMEQGMILDGNFDDWRGNYEQIDDVIVIGVRV